jgi:hypothetical protein
MTTQNGTTHGLSTRCVHAGAFRLGPVSSSAGPGAFLWMRTQVIHLSAWKGNSRK